MPVRVVPRLSALLADMLAGIVTALPLTRLPLLDTAVQARDQGDEYRDQANDAARHSER